MNYEARVDLDRVAADASADGDYGSVSDADMSARRRRKRLIVAIAIILAAAIIAGLMISGGSEETALSASEEGAISTVTVVVPGNITQLGLISATGTLSARREMPVGSAGEGGRIASVAVDAGDYVRAGQVLATIDRSVQSRQAQSSAALIEANRASAQLAQANLDRALQLVERGFISQADIDRLTATRDAAVAQVRIAEAQYQERLARNAQLNIVAPAAGLVLERRVEPGQVVSAGSGTLFSIARDGQMELLAEVSESDLARLSVGTVATVTPVGTTRSFEGQVWQISPVINESTRLGVVRIALPASPALRPGGFATAQINSGSVVSPRLPESAIMSDDKGSYVYIVNAEDTVERRPVKLGLINDEGIEVASVLDGSERVVLRAGGFLTVGEKVRPALQDAD